MALPSTDSADQTSPPTLTKPLSLAGISFVTTAVFPTMASMLVLVCASWRVHLDAIFLVLSTSPSETAGKQTPGLLIQPARSTSAPGDRASSKPPDKERGVTISRTAHATATTTHRPNALAISLLEAIRISDERFGFQSAKPIKMTAGHVDKRSHVRALGVGGVRLSRSP